MARYTGPSCRQCRREGAKLFLKGTKCFTEKCPVERRPYAPGQHGQATARRKKMSEFAKQLREKQKIKRIYGISEKQFRNTFERVSTQAGITGHNLLAALETRLDNVVYRMGFAPSRKAARQLIRHRHIEVKGRLLDIPSYQVRPGEEVRVKQSSRELVLVMSAMEQASKGGSLSWIAVDKESFSGRVLEKPARTSIPLAAQEQLVVELYSK
ncbi:30S ribosomal protein S4 [Gemmatimonas sp.]|mgnify:FL=1|jgi:small subunit ribosomal protein S4|uniref:30S ribosomal protein S4 n=1 Tax=Gemmatimonas sp. TaxID=1962908 RepID=UPI0022C1BE48|nr:30S ribosomal protein S4 [Gemmatimonas sp.]MCA2984433.1 30S ribosomal protein S4 [Gemmatimonas sp.]MCA2988879.1 30S ribosomal protein S4 [Gemmatimonas sp.]MCA2991830.1 30S ribosomal protein S4 [Gemmatimonas sp.]MCA2994508.1 30S ribosomal protein S4 [Gemmatimonas sp.]MCE2954052.1 30S ribosomal protein S4 [Gemmatimonas sp.]